MIMTKRRTKLIILAIMMVLISACQIKQNPTNSNNELIITTNQTVIMTTSNSEISGPLTTTTTSQFSITKTVEQPKLTTRESTTQVINDSKNEGEDDINTMERIQAIINGEIFTITLENNSTTSAFLELLPLSVSMSDLNNNEKYVYLSNSLPTNTQNVNKINAGDFKLFGSNCLVLFYESFTTNYSYTNLGIIDDPIGFREAIKQGSIKVEFIRMN